MAKLNKRRHSFICETCKGNGYIKIVHDNNEDNIHQCWACESEGELYVDESQVVEFYLDDDIVTGDVVKLH
jgi:excinuclease UvrABC ATPase subunit|tara:strand:- start:267 stop:479 length:213 start_codon:yes stop_codon:yes gene_type:complete